MLNLFKNKAKTIKTISELKPELESVSKSENFKERDISYPLNNNNLSEIRDKTHANKECLNDIDFYNSNVNETRHSPPANQEWLNGTYSYNKNFIKTLPIVDNTVNRLIKSYFNLNPLSNDKKSSRVQVRFKRLSLNRILVSRAEMKHTNNKVIITVYLYNKNKKFFLYKLKDLYDTFIFKLIKKSPNLSFTKRENSRLARPNKLQKKSLPFAFDQGKALKKKSNFFSSASSRSLVLNKKDKGTELGTGLVKGNSSSSLKKSTINNASDGAGRKKFRVVILSSGSAVKNKGSSNFSSKRFKNSSRGRLANRNNRFIKTNYYLNFTKLTKRNLSNFLLALNIAKKNSGAKTLKDKYKSLIKKYYFLLSNNKIKTNNNNYYLNYVNIAKTNSSLKNNIALLDYAEEKSNLSSVEYGEEGHNLTPVVQDLYSLALKKSSFFTTRLASGVASGQEELKTRINNNYHKLFDFENVFSKTNQKRSPFGGKALINNKSFISAGVKKSHKKSSNFAGWALYKLRNLHKLFYISPRFGTDGTKLMNQGFEGEESSPNASEIINAHEKNFFDLGQGITLDNALKKRNFLLRNLYNILKIKDTLKKKINSAKASANASANASVSAKASASRIINAPSLTLKKMNSISLKGLRILKKAIKNKNFILKTLKWKNTNFINYEIKYYKNFINKSYRKEILYLYYVKMLSLNNNKFKNWFILGLKRIISKIYNKKVEFNFVNLKYLHLNSDIFSESIAIKLRNRENRLLSVLKQALKLVKLPSLSKLSFYSLPNERVHSHSGKTNEKFAGKDALTLNINSYISMFKDKDLLHELLYKIFPRWGVGNTENSPINRQARSVKNNLQENILNSTKHKDIYGVRLEAAGRLSRRLTASRSVFKLKYKGSLKNINSSYKGLSTVMLRGNTRSNIQLTKVSSVTRNGAFGLKGWISSN